MNKPSYEEVLADPESWLNDRQHRYLRRPGAWARFVHAVLYVANWVSVRLLFRFSVEGREFLPASGPYLITPNHASPLDPPFLGAALPFAVLRHTSWAGKESTVLKTWLRRLLSRYSRVVPIPDDVTALAPAVKVLERGDMLIWFPEGVRSTDGELQTFKPGAVQLLTQCDALVVPVYILGAHAACAERRTWPRLWARVVVRMGPPQTAEQLGLKEAAHEDIIRATDTLRRRVINLRDEPGS